MPEPSNAPAKEAARPLSSSRTAGKERTYELAQDIEAKAPVIMEVHGEHKVYYTPKGWGDDLKE